jgi:hypothetical protein
VGIDNVRGGHLNQSVGEEPYYGATFGVWETFSYTNPLVP